MKTVNIHEAKTHLSRLVEEAAQGQSFIIAKAGRPRVKVVRVDDPGETKERQLGLLEGMWTVPEDFNTMSPAEIDKMFYGAE